MSIDAVDQRWDGFLTQIRGRFDQIMQESIAGCMGLYQQSGEILPLGNAWGAMRIRGMQLGTKVQDTWDDKVSDTYDDAGATAAQEDAARRRGEDLQDYIETELVRVETKIYCDIARSLLVQAQAEQAQVNCTQCAAQLEHSFSLRSVNITCPACGAVNTFVPGSATAHYSGLVHHLCNEAAWDAWLAMHAAERAYGDARSANLELLQRYEGATIEFWTQYLRKRIELDPSHTEAFDADLRGKVHHFYIGIQHEPAWISAGRPRRVPPPTGA